MLLATLNGVNLPPQFSYKPYVPKKRYSITRTYEAVITQYPPNQIVHGEQTIEWTIEAAYPTEFKQLWDLYNTPVPQLYTFTGYWDDEYKVYFQNLEPPSVRGRLFNLSGSFQVVCVVRIYDTLSCSTGL